MNTFIVEIEKIEYCNNINDLRGYKIYTTHGILTFKLCGDQKCCEELHVATSKDINYLLNASILHISHQIESENNNISINDISMTVVIITIMYKLNNQIDTIEIYLSNSHNGYYTHDCMLDWSYLKNGVNNKYFTILTI
jgi:hypothetical protein